MNCPVSEISAAEMSAFLWIMKEINDPHHVELKVPKKKKKRKKKEIVTYLLKNLHKLVVSSFISVPFSFCWRT